MSTVLVVVMCLIFGMFIGMGTLVGLLLLNKRRRNGTKH